ncbi:efflux RND transporter periplasmic adaptor subunit [Thalassospira sp.]|uniref:efflux RND transporter periplasmic adaptor subunit n=1 Tax=Thalassospira sp. TaxID=1912094 RepID=UPI003AA9636F
MTFSYRHSALVVLALCLVLVGGLSPVFAQAGAQTPTDPDPFAQLLENARQGNDTGDQQVGAEQNVCQVSASELVELASPVDGVIHAIHAGRGQRVKKGDLIAELQAEVEKAQVNYAQVRAQSQSSVAARKRQLEFTERRIKRTEKLRAAKLMTQEEIDTLETDRDSARLDYEAAKENITIMKAELALSRAQLADRMIKSPIDGVLIEKLLTVGEQVDGKAIALIAQLDPLFVEVSLPVARFGKYKKGEKVVVHFDGPNLPSSKAEISLVDQIVEPKSKTFGMRIVLPNPDLAIPAGIGCHIEFLSPKIQ